MLRKVRQDIDDIDQQIVDLLEKRYACVDEVIRVKEAHQLEVLDSKREKEVIQNMAQQIKNKEYEFSILETLQHMMDVSKAYQGQKKKHESP
ncbi:MAG: chorismate mutase [Vagococcus sp.]